MSAQTLVGVIGSKECSEETYTQAREVGKLLAQK